MTLTARKSKKRGFALLLTLMVLVLLAGLIVHFQADSALQVRASRYRLQQLQCRYAAESALVAAMQLIRSAQLEGIYRQPTEAPTTESLLASLGIPGIDDPCRAAVLSGLLDPCAPADPCSVFDPCSLLDPCSVLDPCSLAELLREALEAGGFWEEPSPFQFMKKTVKIGSVSVEIRIFDENSKYPVYWMLQGPIENSKDHGGKSLQLLGTRVGASPEAVRQATSLVQEIGQPLKVIKPISYLYRRSYSRGTVRSRSMTWRLKPTGIKPTLNGKPVTHTKLLHHQMSAFHTQWRDTLREDDKYEDLQTPLADQNVSLADYLGTWGNGTININTAPAEVLEAAFRPLGFTPANAKAIVEYRKKRPFQHTTHMFRVGGLNRTTMYAIRTLCTTQSDTYSVRVKARLGRAQYNLWGGIYKDRKNQFVHYAAFTGD